MGFFETLIAFLILVGFLIWFHELGHFLFAKAFGVKVEVFSVGFGPRIFSKQVGETLYQVSAIPLGGYVKLYGEEEGIDDPRAFSSKPPWQRILIALAGPLFNLILAVILFTVVFKVGVEVPKYFKEPVLVGYVEENSWAQKVGIREGDRIVEIGGVPVEKWEDLRKALIESALKGEREIAVKVLRGKEEIILRGPKPDIEGGEEILGIQPFIGPVVGSVIEEIPGLGPSPAFQVGLRRGDVILEVNGKRVKSWYEVVEEIRKSQGRPIKLVIKREDKVIEKTVVPVIHPGTQKPMLGISPLVETYKVSYSLGEALNKALERTWDLTKLTFEFLYGLVTGSVSFKALGGPIAIAQFAGQSAQLGLIPYLNSMAFISLQLAIFNLLPLPILDGGLILLFLIEMIRRRPLPEKFKEYWQRAGFALIVTLMFFVILNDLLRLIR